MRFLLLLIVSLLPSLVHASGYPSVWNSSFKNGAGNLVSPTPSDKPTLFLFWANWCVPCKAELTEIANHPDTWKEFRLIAVNIDEAHERKDAEKSLETIGWRDDSWFDEDGKVFTAVQEAGDLPLTLLFSKDGRFLDHFSSTTEAKIETFRALIEKDRESSRLGHFRFDDSFQYRSLDNAASKFPLLYSNVSTLGWDSKDISLQTESYSIRQRRFSGFQPWENELGRTYVRYRNVWAGDQGAHIHQGMILSLRALPGSDQNSSLLGLSYSNSEDGNLFRVFGGKIRDLLFAFQLDPSQDLTRSVPDEWTLGFEFERKLSDSFSSGLSSALYGRDEDLILGYPSPKHDLRIGAPFRWHGEKLNADFAPVFYRDLKHDESAFSGELSLGARLGEHLSTPFVFQISRQDFPRVYFSTLIEAPALPLSVDRKRTYSFSPKWTIGKRELTLSTIYETGYDQNQGDTQKTLYASYQDTSGSWKSHAALQHENLSSTNSKTSEYFLDATAKTLRTLTIAVFLKAHSTHGSSAELQTGIDLLPAFDLSALQALSLVGSWAEQRGSHYFGYSGISDKSLRSIQLRAASRHAGLNLAYGKQSGGLQCTGGVCTQVPALNGIRAAVETHWVF